MSAVPAEGAAPKATMAPETPTPGLEAAAKPQGEGKSCRFRRRKRAGGFAWFFTKQVMAFILLAMLVVVVDFALYIAVGLYASEEYASANAPASVVKMVDANLTHEDGGWWLAESAQRQLEQADAWALLLDSGSGALLWSSRLPADVPRAYDLNEVAVAAHFAELAGYPAAFWTRDDGLLVAGGPKGSFWTMGLTYPTQAVDALIWFVVFVFVADFIILYLYGLHARNKTRRAVGPLSDALDDLSRGVPVDLHLSGDLREVGESVTRVSDELRRKDEAREQWIRGVSHDIRTPLSLITGNADAIACDVDANEDVRAGAEAIRAQSLRIADLVNDLNTAALLEYDAQPLDAQPVQLAPLVRQVAAEYLNGMLPAGYTLEVDIGGTVPLAGDASTVQVLGDARMLTRALQNLVNNAVLHNPEGCHIVMRLTCSPLNARLSVEDDGRGMPAAEVEALRSRIAVGAGSADVGGHGLGLVLVSKVAASHGGGLRIEAGEERGFSALLWLPVFR